MHSRYSMPDTTGTTRARSARRARPPKLFLVASLFFALVAALYVMTGQTTRISEAQSALSSQGEIYTVQRVVDGDTVEVDRPIQGDDNVRLIGVDTPETVDPGEPVQPFGPEASEFTTQRLEGREVALEFDEERVDSFGRPLAYVYTSQDELFNETLVREGYAQVATFPPNTRYEDLFEEAQEKAREACRGIWGLPAEKQRQLADQGNDLGATAGECAGGGPGSGGSPGGGGGPGSPSVTPPTGGVPLAPIAAVLLALGVGARLTARAVK